MRKSIIGTGIFNLDTIVVREYPEWPAMRPFKDKVVLEEVGGTCGNVMCMLSWLGWDAKPVVYLDDSAEGRKVAEDLKRYGCDCRYVTNKPGGGTTLLRCTHKKTADGQHVMSVRTGSPGGSRFPKRHFLRARDEAPAFLETVQEAPAVFFFDDPAAGNRLIAKGMKEKGALVYFEPGRIMTGAKLEAIELSDIIKFSDEAFPDVDFADGFSDKLFIQTLGAKGVRIKYMDRPWETVDGMKNDHVIDTEGAGDWFSSAFINALAEAGSLDYEGVMSAVKAALVVSSESVGYMGSKGYIHAQRAETEQQLG